VADPATSARQCHDTRGAIATRRRILDAAGRVFDDVGVTGLTIEQVASEAGVSRGVLLRHFANRRALVTSYVGEILDERRAGLQRLRQTHADDPRAMLVAFARQIHGCGPGHPGRRRSPVHLAAELADPGHPLCADVIDLRRTYVAFLAEQLRRLGHTGPDATARAMLMVLTGAVTASALEGRDDSPGSDSAGSASPESAIALRVYTALIDIAV
jgi:AcrR family transcriptional regulator